MDKALLIIYIVGWVLAAGVIQRKFIDDFGDDAPEQIAGGAVGLIFGLLWPAILLAVPGLVIWAIGSAEERAWRWLGPEGQRRRLASREWALREREAKVSQLEHELGIN